MAYLSLQSLTGFLVLVLCDVHICSHPMSEQHEQTTLLEGKKLRVYLSNEEGLEPNVLPWKCQSGHTMGLCDNCYNCAKFHFYAEKVFKDIPFFLILNHFMSTM